MGALSGDAHDPGPEHPDIPARVTHALAGARRAGAVIVESDRRATHAELERVHSPRYLAHLRSIAGHASELDHETRLSPLSIDAAYCAAGTCFDMVDALLDGRSRRSFVVVRPPGHHAEPDRGMGYCVLSNVALAAAHALARGARNVLVVDWDAHHGNGTQRAFYASRQVHLFDLHQDRLFPASGGLDEQGEGDGLGATMNVPLDPGASLGDYLHAFDELLPTFAERAAPDLILVSCGFDAHERDPLSDLALSTEAFGALTARVVDLAERHARGRVGLVLEGGYALEAVASSVEQCVAALSDVHPHAHAAAPLYTTRETVRLLKARHASR